MKVKDQAHQFALYIKNLEQIKQKKNIDEKDLIHRIINILRLEVNNELILFDENKNILIKLKNINKKNIEFDILKEEKNKKFRTKIISVLPILKRNHFEEALYNLVEIGVDEIQLVNTTKSANEFFKIDRIKSIIVSAAEQSKNFSSSHLKNAISLDTFLSEIKKLSFPKIFFDPSGENILDVIEREKKFQKTKEIILFVGPEGDLTQDEKDQLNSAGFIFCKLTPTILRASSAITLGSGIFRSIFE
ncbi:16S rRNA (uracil(1498)-N(3))-methyltransferase [Candidatus Dependentiae bacterium]|nr:16S rRNA (uracil(1498)-N(3))-methyltransferase [Candidatus Dependentiae bacterium]